MYGYEKTSGLVSWSLLGVSFHVAVNGLAENGQEEVCVLHRDAHGRLDAEGL